ncbi:helix-turn-helix transcriptional regulator [Pseudomonas sp. GW456-E7]|nr:helix-turn-helix transcriptional regulator [Pseudomonas sp. GW456-E7]
MPASKTISAPLASYAVDAHALSPKYTSAHESESHLLRSGLLEQMDNAKSAKLILIRAAAGFGKTTLLQQYRQRCLTAGKRVLWLNLESADNDLQRFTSLLTNGLKPLLEPRGVANQQSQDLSGMVSSCEIPLIICLDEFEVIHDVEVLDCVQHLIDVLPANCALAITSRSTPGLGLGRIRARGHMLDIKPGDLRFSLEESTRFLREKRKIALRDKEISMLHRCTEGWITGLYLASLSLQGRDDHEAFIASFSGSNLELAEYLTEDILARQSEECRDFLMHTSITGQLCASLCNALTGRNDSQAMIEQLERTNLFLQSVDSQQQWYRYHSLFASFLRDALDRLHPGKVRQLHAIAAQWFLEADQPIRAIEHLFSADLVEEAITQLATHLDSLIDSGRVLLLLRWLDRAPESVRDRYPHLNQAYAWLLALSNRLQEARQVAERLERLAGPAFGYVPQVIHCLQLSISDQVDECCAVGRQVLSQIPPGDVHLHGALVHCVAMNLLSSGCHEQVQALLSAMLQRDKRLNPSFLGYTLNFVAGIQDMIQARPGSALSRFQAMRDAPRKEYPGQSQDTRVALDVMFAVLHYEAGQLDESSQLLTNALPFTRYFSSPDILIASHVLSARIAYLRGDRSTWQRCLVDLEQLGREATSERIGCSVWLERSRVAIVENRLDMAEQALHSAEQMSEWDRPDLVKFASDVDTPSIARQRLRIARGEYALAARCLRQAIDDARRYQHHRRELKLTLLLALALDGMGDQQQAFDTLQLALRAASHEGLRRTLEDEGESLMQLLIRWSKSPQAAKAVGIEPGFIESLVSQYDVSRVSPARQLLTDREFQVLQLLAVGHRNKTIAEKIFLSELTVKSHLQKLYAKLEVSGRTEALANARTRGLIA